MVFGPEFEVINVFCHFLSLPVLFLSTECLLYPWISSLAKSRDSSRLHFSGEQLWQQCD
jgi:uncharacterized membrane protein YGL010W